MTKEEKGIALHAGRALTTCSGNVCYVTICSEDDGYNPFVRWPLTFEQAEDLWKSLGKVLDKKID